MESQCCVNYKSNPESFYFEPMCYVGHTHKESCMKGGGGCEDFEPSKIPTIEELKEKFGKPKCWRGWLDLIIALFKLRFGRR